MNRRSFMKAAGVALAGFGLSGSVQANPTPMPAGERRDKFIAWANSVKDDITQEDLTNAYKSLPDYNECRGEVEIQYSYPERFTVEFPDGDNYVFMGHMDEDGTICSVDGDFQCQVSPEDAAREIKENI